MSASTTLVVTQLLQIYLQNAISANALLMKAQAENRPITQEELAELSAGVAKSGDMLQAEIDRQRAEGG
jgi:hypothetical protein